MEIFGGSRVRKFAGPGFRKNFEGPGFSLPKNLEGLGYGGFSPKKFKNNKKIGEMSMNEITINITAREVLKKLGGVGSNTSAIYMPKRYISVEVCIIPVNYKVEVPQPDEDGMIRMSVNSEEIYRKTVKRAKTGGVMYVPQHLTKVDMLVFAAPLPPYESITL